MKRINLKFWIKQFALSTAIVTMICVSFFLFFNIGSRLVIMESNSIIRYTEVSIMILSVGIIGKEYLSNINWEAKRKW